MGAKVWTGKGGASVADPDNWEYLTTAQFNSVENGGAMVEDLNKQEIKCPQCLGVWPIRSEQAAAVCKHGKCVCCLVDNKEEFEPGHMRVIDTQKGVTTRAAAEKAHRDTVKDLAGAGFIGNAAKRHHAERMSEQAAAMIGMAPEDLDACGGERIPVRTLNGEGDHFIVVNDLTTTDDMTERRIAQAERVVALVKEWVELEFPPGTVCAEPNEADKRTFMEWLEDYRDQIFKAMALPPELLSDPRDKTEPESESIPSGYWSKALRSDGISETRSFHWWPKGAADQSSCRFYSTQVGQELEIPRNPEQCCNHCIECWRAAGGVDSE